MKSIDPALKQNLPARYPLALLGVALAGLLLALASGPAAARKSDRDAPLDISADGSLQGTLDEDGTATLKGNVHISQGTMHVYADVATVTRVAGDFNKVVFEGKPARLNQVNDDGTPMKAQALRIDYDVASEIVVLTGAVMVEQERGTLTGERVTYNLSSGELDSRGDGAGGRIQIKILPKNKTVNKPASKEGG